MQGGGAMLHVHRRLSLSPPESEPREETRDISKERRRATFRHGSAPLRTLYRKEEEAQTGEIWGGGKEARFTCATTTTWVRSRCAWGRGLRRLS